MTEDDDFGPPLIEESDAGLDIIEDSLENVLEENSEPPTLKEWKAMDVENSPIAFYQPIPPRRSGSKSSFGSSRSGSF